MARLFAYGRDIGAEARDLMSIAFRVQSERADRQNRMDMLMLSSVIGRRDKLFDQRQTMELKLAELGIEPKGGFETTPGMGEVVKASAEEWRGILEDEISKTEAALASGIEAIANRTAASQALGGVIEAKKFAEDKEATISSGELDLVLGTMKEKYPQVDLNWVASGIAKYNVITEDLQRKIVSEEAQARVVRAQAGLLERELGAPTGLTPELIRPRMDKSRAALDNAEVYADALKLPAEYHPIIPDATSTAVKEVYNRNTSLLIRFLKRINAWPETWPKEAELRSYFKKYNSAEDVGDAAAMRINASNIASIVANNPSLVTEYAKNEDERGFIYSMIESINPFFELGIVGALPPTKPTEEEKPKPEVTKERKEKVPLSRAEKKRVRQLMTEEQLRRQSEFIEEKYGPIPGVGEPVRQLKWGDIKKLVAPITTDLKEFHERRERQKRERQEFQDLYEIQGW